MNSGDEAFHSPPSRDYFGLAIFFPGRFNGRTAGKSWRAYTIASYHPDGNKGVAYTRYIFSVAASAKSH